MKNQDFRCSSHVAEFVERHVLLGRQLTAKHLPFVLVAKRGGTIKYRHISAGTDTGDNGSGCPGATKDRWRAELEIEKKWIERARVDNEAFEFFYHKYRSRVFRRVLAASGDVDVASDLTDETFYRVFNNLSEFTWGDCLFGGYLAKIARNLVMEEFRCKKSRRETAFDSQVHGRDSGHRPDREAVVREEIQILHGCLNPLRADPLQVFLLHYGEEMTTKEIAVEMGIAEATVKSHLQRGRTWLRTRLGECGVDRGGFNHP